MKIRNSKGEVVTVPDEYKQKVKDNIDNPEYISALAEQFKSGGMIKRKDGSYSRRGLWDNIRANRGSGKKPTKEMLKQEAKIRAKAKDGLLVKAQDPQENTGLPVRRTISTPSKKSLFQEYFNRYPERPETDSLLQNQRTPENVGLSICDENGCRPYNAPNFSEEERIKLYKQAWGEKIKQGYDPVTNSRLPYNQRLLELYPPSPGSTNPNFDVHAPNFIHWYDEVDSSGKKLPLKQAAGGTVFKGYVTEQPMGEAVPWHTSTIGEKMGKGGYTVKRSSARKGKTHVVIGPDGTKKYFGDSHLGQHPGNPKRKKAFYARHKHNLAKNPYFRAFARATWADGGKLSQNMYDLGVMPYADGGYTFGNMNPDGTIHVPYGYATPAYNEKYDFGGWVTDFGKIAVNSLAAPVEQISGNNFVNFRYDNKAMADAAAVSEGIIGGATDVVGSMYLGPAYGMAKGAIQPTTSKMGHSKEAQRGADKWANQTGQIASSAGNLVSGIMSGNPQQIVGGAGQFLGTTGQQLGSKELATTGQLAGAASQFMGPSAMPQGTQMGSPMANMVAKRGGYIMAAGGPVDPEQLEALQGVQDQEGNQEQMAEQSMQQGMVPINVEGANFNSGSGPNAKKGELLVNQGRIVKNYVGRPPHPEEGQNPMGNDNAPEGLIVIPKYRTKEYLEAGLEKRKQIERSLVSQQQDREMKKMKRPSKKMGDGGYYSFGGDESGMGYGGTTYSSQLGRGMTYSNQLGGHDYAARGGPIGNPETIDSMMGYGYKKGGWIKRAINPAHKGWCTPLSNPHCTGHRKALALRFKHGDLSKKEHGGMIDPVTGSDHLLYAEGGQLPESLLRTRMRASGASPEEISNYVAAHYADGGETKMPDMNITYKKGGGIYIKPANRGKFTSWAKSHGMGVQEAAQHVMANKDKYSSTIVKRANFAKNAARWKHEMGGPVNVDRSDIYEGMRKRAEYGGRLRYDEYSVTGGPNLTSSGPLSASAPYTSMGPVTYQDWSAQHNNITAPGFDGSGAYTQNLGKVGPAATPNYTDTNWANIGQDVAGVAPILYNLGRGLFEKPFKMNALDYMTPDMKWRATKFDRTPYTQAISRALYNNQTGLAGRAAITSGGAQGLSQGYMDWLNKEYLRHQGVDQANLENIRANNAIKMQTAIMNRQAIDRKSDFLAESANQLAQTFGRDPRYFAALAGDTSAYRQPFTGWRSNG